MRCQLTVILISVVTATASQSAIADPVKVPDPQLKALLHEILKRKGVESGSLEAEDLATIHFLNGRNRKIANLTGMKYCVELQEARLDGNAIKDVTPLAACVKMKSLDLSSNQIASIEPLKTLTELRYLNIEGNSVKEIGCVKSMGELTSLFANNNQISDLSPLKGRTRLHSLYLAGNKVSDLGALATLKRLGSLDLRKNQIVDVEPLKSLKRLRWTFLSENRVEDISPLADMAAQDQDKEFAPYWRLYLEGNPLADDAENHAMTLITAGVNVRLKSPPTASKSDDESEESAR